MGQRRSTVSVVGGAVGAPELLEEAERIGRGLVDAGFRLATGGRGGVMEAASRGARSSAIWSDGSVVGVLPSLDPSEANPFVDIVVPTGLNHARNVVLVAMADVVVAIGGGCGTLSEIALACKHGKPVVALTLGDGWAARLAGQVLDDQRPSYIRGAGTAAGVVAAVREILRA